MTDEKVKELLIPRVKVVAPWPNMPKWCKVGAILTQTSDYGTAYYQLNVGELPPSAKRILYNKVHECKTLFQSIHWWEGRSELPKYVRLDKKVYKVMSKFYDNRRFGHCETELEDRIFRHNLTYWGTPYLPATESEYNEYLKSKTL